MILKHKNFLGDEATSENLKTYKKENKYYELWSKFFNLSNRDLLFKGKYDIGKLFIIILLKFSPFSISSLFPTKFKSISFILI